MTATILKINQRPIIQLSKNCSCKHVYVSIKCIWPDPVEYVPAMQSLQSREPAGESRMQNQSTAIIIVMIHAAV